MTPAEHAYLDLFINNFAARDDAYVLDSRQHIPERLTPPVLAKHWAEGHAVSVYTGKGMFTQVGALDLDAGTLADALPVVDLLAENGIPSLYGPSRRGAHIWTFHTAKDYGMVESRVVQAALTMAVGLSGWPHPLSKAEVFPRRGSSDWSCGALRLPLMKHPKDGQTRPMWASGERLTRVSEVVEAVSVMTSDYDRMRAFSAIDAARGEYPVNNGVYAKPRVYDDDAPTVSALLGGQVHPGHTMRCPFHDDSHSSLSIALDDERAWCKAPHCDLYNDGKGMGSFQLGNYLRERSHVAA